MRYFSYFVIIFIVILSTCIDPYTPNLKGYESLLVVDGKVADDGSPFTVRLSRTIREQTAIPEIVHDATVFITDDLGNSNSLFYAGNGYYKSDSLEARGVAGREYVLHILTGNGAEYASEPCMLQAVPDIDSIYFEKGEELFNNGTENYEGVRILLDSEGGEKNKYYKWDFEETWKFKVPYVTNFKYINEFTIPQISDPREYCWKSHKSDNIIIRQVTSGVTDSVRKIPITFIASEKSDRLLIQYSILVKQYSVSQKEYQFWNNLVKVNKTGDDIFAAQPYPVVGNIHNVNNKGEQVLGYFQVSAVKQKRKEITFNDVVGLNLPYYHYSCKSKEDSPNIYPWILWNPPLTWDDIYNMYTSSGYTFVGPKYDPDTRELDRLVFTSPECADCALTGNIKKPDFWIDLN